MLLRSFRSEIKKLLSKHTVVGLLVTLCLLTPLTALALRVMFSGYSGLGAPLISSAMQSPSELLLVVFCSNNVLCVLLGTLVFTSGYSTMTIYRDFQVFQNRLVALAGKLLAVEAAVCAASLLSSLLGVLILNLGSTDQFSLTEPLDMIVSCVLNSLLITLFSFGVGLVLSKTVSALITTVSILFILPDVVRTILASLNLLNPTGHVMHQQFNIQQLYALPTLYLCVLYLSENKQRLVPLTA